jgi:drug/metabolite transporter (DMT)-like permease
MKGQMRGAIFLLVFFITTVLANFCFKYGAQTLGPLTLSPRTLTTALGSPFVLIGATLYAVAAVTWIVALSIVPLNIATSVSAFVYVGIVIMAALVFGEIIPPMRWAGITFIVIGMVIIAITA